MNSLSQEQVVEFSKVLYTARQSSSEVEPLTKTFNDFSLTDAYRIQAHGIQPLLLFTPESPTFRAWYGEPGDTAVSLLAAGIAAEFGVPLIDARGWLTDDELADGHHAMPSGAKTFTDKLAVVLKEMAR